MNALLVYGIRLAASTSKRSTVIRRMGLHLAH